MGVHANLASLGPAKLITSLKMSNCPFQRLEKVLPPVACPP